MDIQRYLADDPVLACPPSALYRLRKLARRYKTLVLAASVLTAALIIGSAVSIWQAVRATRAERVALTATIAESEARRAAEAERNKAESQRAEADKNRQQAVANLEKARAAVDESFTLVSESKLLDIPGLQPLRMELMESALRYYQSFALEHSGQPRTMADVAATYLRTAQINMAIDRSDEATTAVKHALDIIGQMRREHPEDRESQIRLAGFFTERRWLKRSTAFPRDRISSYMALMRLQRQWEQLAEQHPTEIGFQSDLLGIYSTIGATLHWGGRAKEATDYFRKTVSIGERLVQINPADSKYRSAFADANLQLSKNLSALGFFDEALALAQRSTQLHQALVSEFPEIPEYQASLVTSMVEIGDRTAKEQPLQAEQVYRDAFKLADSLVNRYPGYILYVQIWSVAGLQLATLEGTMGKHDESVATMQRMTHTLQALQAASFKEAKTREGLAFECFFVANRVPPVPNQVAFSEQLFQFSLDLLSRLADEFPDVDNYREHTAHCHQALGWRKLLSHQLDEAAEHYRTAIPQF
ncbi:MAG TPA: hypothetical protein DCF63_12005, partial [Planctomycetaceae bacterium]|nr:hypothetical protein [Planctomycetaceae bacterium]